MGVEAEKLDMMSDRIAIKVFEVVGSKLCVASSDGQLGKP